MDLHLMVCAAGALVGVALIVLGLRLLAPAAAGRGGARRFVVSGIVFTVIGAAAIGLAAFSLFGPARDRGLGIFPMSVLDLEAPAEAPRPGPPLTGETPAKPPPR